MPFTPPSIYAPGTVDLLSLIMQAKSGTSGLHKALTGQASPLSDLDLGEGIGASPASAAAGNGTAQSVAVGNATIGSVAMGMAGMMGVPGLAMSAASALGLTPPTLQGMIAKSVAHALDPNGLSVDTAGIGIDAVSHGFSQAQDSEAANVLTPEGGGDSDSPDPDGSSAAGTSSSAGNTTDGSVSDGSNNGNLAKGGIIRGKGTSTSDSIPINASDGEYMLPAHVVQAIGKPFLDHLISSIPNVISGN